MCRVQNQLKAGTAICTFFLFNLYQFVILHKIFSFNLAILDIAFTCTQWQDTGTDKEIQQSKRTRKTKAGGKMFRKKFRKIQDEKELLDG